MRDKNNGFWINYIAIAILHTFQSTTAHALEFLVFTSRILATDLSTKTSASNHCEVFLLFLLQSPWNLGTQLKLRLLLYSSSLPLYLGRLLLKLNAPPTFDCPQTTFVLPYKPSARLYRKHVTWSLSTVVWRHCLRGSMFTELLPRSGFT
jgi:hypothetical protein